MDAMHSAFTIPLLDEEAYREALRQHFLVALDGLDYVETSNINLLSLNTSYAYLLTYAEFRNNMLRSEDAAAKHFVQSFYSAVVQEEYEDLFPEQNAEWVDVFGTLIDNDGSVVYVEDGKPLSETPSEYRASIPGLVNLPSDRVMDFVLQMAVSVARELVNNGNIPVYFDIALGYLHGDTIEIRGTTVHDTLVILNNEPSYGHRYTGAMGRSTGGLTLPNIGRGLTAPNFFYS